jgi:hypothetical protein
MYGHEMVLFMSISAISSPLYLILTLSNQVVSYISPTANLSDQIWHIFVHLTIVYILWAVF